MAAPASPRSSGAYLRGRPPRALPDAGRGMLWLGALLAALMLVGVLFGDDVYPLHPPGTGERHQHAFPWALPLTAVRDLLCRTSSPASHS